MWHITGVMLQICCRTMKRTVLLAFFLISITASYAQPFNIGLRTGLHTTSIDSKKLLIKDAQSLEEFETSISDAEFGFHIGMFMRFSVAAFYLQPEVWISSKRADYTWQNISSDGPLTRYTFDWYDIEVPVVLGIKAGAVRFEGGLVANTIIDSWSELGVGSGSLSSVRTGYLAGLGLDLGNFLLDVRYEGSLSGWGDELNIENVDFVFDSRPERFLLTLGYGFIKRN